MGDEKEMIIEYTTEFLHACEIKPVKGAKIDTKAGVFRLYLQCWNKPTWYAYSNNIIGFMQSRVHLLKKAFNWFKYKHFYGALRAKGALKTPEGCIPTMDDIG
ncbi:MAG: hypothetical protein ACYDG6_14635 [Thermincolia bacterium]